MKGIGDYKVDPARRTLEPTGIRVRAKDGGRWGPVDLQYLDRESLMDWLRSDGGHNELAERTVAMLLGHDLGDPPKEAA